ncbi:MAG: carboxypeptidase-like regulatory domain-containing protein [Pyrinomonadaceae bacterium]
MRTHPIRIQAGLLLSLFLLMSVAAGGQVLTGTLTGFVTDPTNARIPGAAVTVIDLSTGRQYETISNDLGEFTFPNLTNGFYRVTVESSGFSKFIAESVQVNVAQTARIVAKPVSGLTSQ